MKREVDFSKEYEYDVEVYGDDLGVLGEGELSFGGGGLVRVSFEPIKGFRSLEGGAVLKAKTKNGLCFTLFNCTCSDYSLYADFVVAGDVKSGFNYFELKYGDISDWFLRGQTVKGEVGESISWSNPVPQMSVCLTAGDENFSLRTVTVGSITRSGEDHIIHEHTCFVFERGEGEFSLDEIKNKSFELSTLLSILIACPVSVVNMRVGCGEGYPMSVYFPSFKSVERDSSGAFWLSCFTSRASLDGKWQSVFERYYSSPYRRSSWVRLAGMQRYEGFWEFKVLGYVSLLDEYVTNFAKINNQKATRAENKRVTRLLVQLKSLQVPLDGKQFEGVESLVKSIFLVSRDLTFREKYDYAISSTDENIVKIVNLTDEDFVLIKEVRDKIAHGETPDLVDSSYQEIHLIVEKLALLMTYWAHVDLGFSSSDFAGALMWTHNRLHFNPGLNKVHLQRITNAAQFITVSDELFEMFASGKRAVLNACFTQNVNGEISYSESYMSIWNAWVRDRSRHRGHQKMSDIFGVEPDRLNHVGTLYLECAGKLKELHGVYIIKEDLQAEVD
jgi:hypothetical protein